MAGKENMQAFNEVPEVPPFFITRHSHNHLCADCSMLAGAGGKSQMGHALVHLACRAGSAVCSSSVPGGLVSSLSSKQLDLTVIASVPLPVSLWPSKYLPVQSRNACPGETKSSAGRGETAGCLPTPTSKSAPNILRLRSVL